MSTTSSTTALSPDSARQGYDRSAPVRVAVLGVGMMGQDHARRLARVTAGAELVAVSDVDVARTDAVAAEFGVRAIHDPRAAIVDPQIDALVIATPGFTHEDLVLLALEAGKPVLCEKPLTTTPETSRRIVEAEAALGRRLVQVGFMRRFDAGYEQLRALIASGEYGAPLFLHCAHRNATTPPNFSSEMLMLDSVVHEVDAVRFLTGEEVVAIRVIAPRSTTSAPEGLLDPQFVLMETESGVLVDVEIFVNTTFGYEVRTELVAEKGQVRIGLPGGLAGGMVTQSGRGWGGSIPKDFKERFGAAYDTEFQRWIDAVRAGTNVDGPGVWDGYAAAAVCAAGVQSLKTGERVVIDLGPRP